MGEYAALTSYLIDFKPSGERMIQNLAGSTADHLSPMRDAKHRKIPASASALRFVLQHFAAFVLLVLDEPGD